MYITILDFETGKTYVRKVPKKLENKGNPEPDDVINYYEKILKIHTTDCQFMITKEIDINLK